jgi:hypothetical protein
MVPETLPPFNLFIGAIVITVAILLFWLPLRKTRKARGHRIPAGAGVQQQGRALVYFSSPCRRSAAARVATAGAGY